jgi:NitT/TauT family transport system substrate-binding protein
MVFPRRARADAPLTIRVATTPDDASMAVVYAERTGRFRATGLDVEISQQSSGAAIAAGIIGGAYDVGKSSLTSVLSAHLRNIPFTFIAPGGVSDVRVPYGHLIVANDSGITSAKDLNGKTLSVAALGSLDPVTISAWIDANGGDAKTVKFVEIPQTESGAAVAAHRIAAALIIHPQVDEALAAGNVHVLGDPYGALAPLYLISGWFATSDWVRAHPDAAQKFARVVEDTASYANAHHADTAPVLADFSKIPLPVISKMTRAVLGTSLTPALIQPVIDASVKYGALARTFSAAEIITS